MANTQIWEFPVGHGGTPKNAGWFLFFGKSHRNGWGGSGYPYDGTETSKFISEMLKSVNVSQPVRPCRMIFLFLFVRFHGFEGWLVWCVCVWVCDLDISRRRDCCTLPTKTVFMNSSCGVYFMMKCQDIIWWFPWPWGYPKHDGLYWKTHL